MSLFRHMLRIDYEEGRDGVDERLVAHLESLKALSANRQQEWVRNALRNTFLQEELYLLSSQEKTNEQGCKSGV